MLNIITDYPIDSTVIGKVMEVNSYGIYLQLSSSHKNIRGFIDFINLYIQNWGDLDSYPKIGDNLYCLITSINYLNESDDIIIRLRFDLQKYPHLLMLDINWITDRILFLEKIKKYYSIQWILDIFNFYVKKNVISNQFKYYLLEKSLPYAINLDYNFEYIEYIKHIAFCVFRDIYTGNDKNVKKVIELSYNKLIEG